MNPNAITAVIARMLEFFMGMILLLGGVERAVPDGRATGTPSQYVQPRMPRGWPLRERALTSQIIVAARGDNSLVITLYGARRRCVA
jgi:hypothetical protein